MTKQNQAVNKGMEDLKARHMASLGVAHESGKKLHKGMAELTQLQSAHVANIFEDTMNTMKSIISAKTLQDAANIHKDWVQKSMKLGLEHNSQLTKKTVELMKHVSAPAQEHIKKTTAEAIAKTKEFAKQTKENVAKATKK